MPRPLLAAIGGAALLAAAPLLAGDKPVPALYKTRAEAERAAPLFHCKGAHPMGNAWMPCASHPGQHNPPLAPSHGQH